VGGTLLVTGDGLAVVGNAVVGVPPVGAALVRSAVLGAVLGELVAPLVDAVMEPDGVDGDVPAELSRDCAVTLARSAAGLTPGETEPDA